MSEIKLPAASGGGSISIKGPASSGSDVDLLDTSGNLKLSDSDELRLGTGDDLKLYHDGSNTYIDNATGDLKIRGDNIRFRSKSVDEMQISTYVNGAVQMAYDGSMKFETISTGVNVTGGVRIGGNNTANELDDYETGTFTPSIDAVSAGWNSRTGTYIKVGDIVTVFIHLSTASGGSTNSDQVAITGLPFTSENTNGQGAASVGYHNGILSDNYEFPFLMTAANTTKIVWYKGNGGSFTGSDMVTSNFGLHVSCTYKAA